MNLRHMTALTYVLVAVTSVWCAMPAESDTPAEPVLRVGVATTTITPDGPVYMAGFAARKERSEAVYDDLTATALVVDNGLTRIGLMAIDIIGIGPVQLADIRDAARKVGIPPEQMMVNSSHTHCGPIFERNGDFPEMFKSRTCGLLQQAVDDLKPVTLEYYLGSCTMGISRRRLGPGGQATWQPGVDQPADLDTPVLVARSAEGSPKAIVFGYACHPTTINGLEIGPDYPGFARKRIVRAFPGCTPMFLQGCGGDIKPRTIRPDLRFAYDDKEEMAELGHELARAALAAMCQDPVKLTPDLSGASRLLDIPTKKDPAKTSQIEVQALRIGKLCIAGSNGEVCSPIGLHAKRKLAGMPLWVNGYTNLRVSYIPPKSAHEHGGYEVDRTPFVPEAEDMIVSAIVELVQECGLGTRAEPGPEE